LATLPAGYQRAHCDLYLNETQTTRLINDLGNAGGLVGGGGIVPAAIGLAGEDIIAAVSGWAALIIAGISFQAWVGQQVIQRIDQDGGNQGIYFDFDIFRVWAEVPMSFSWPWDPVRYQTFWSAWQYLPYSGYVWYQGSSPASPLLARLGSAALI